MADKTGVRVTFTDETYKDYFGVTTVNWRGDVVLLYRIVDDSYTIVTHETKRFSCKVVEKNEIVKREKADVLAWLARETVVSVEDLAGS